MAEKDTGSESDTGSEQDDNATETTSTADTAEEWEAEAGKWKEQAEANQQAANEHADAAQRLEELQASEADKETAAAAKLEQAKTEAAEDVEAAKAEGAKTVEEWQAEAEKWKTLSRKHEDQAKSNRAAAKRLEKLETENTETESKVKADTVDLETKAADAEAKANRYEVAAAMGVPAELMQFLTGSSKQELEDQADRLLASIDKNPPAEDDDDADDTDDDKPDPSAELKEAQERAAKAETKALRFEVAAAKGLPPDLAVFLSADSREDLIAQADVLLNVATKQADNDVSTRARMPTKKLRSGAVPADDADLDPDPAELATSIRRQQRGY